MRRTAGDLWLSFVVAAVAALGRAPYVWHPHLFYSSDTAVTDLMARHVLAGELSLYYWGERYYGALDQLPLAALFHFLGSGPAVSRLLPFALWVLTVAAFHVLLLRTESRGIAHPAALLLALSPPLYARITFSTYNYAFVALLGVLHLLAAETMSRGRITVRQAAAVGFLAGLSWYYFQLIVVFWVAAGGYWLARNLTAERKALLRDHLSSVDSRFLWRRICLLEGADLPAGGRRALAVVNLVNAANLLLAGVLWVTGDFRARAGNWRISIPFWPTLRTSLLVGAVVALVGNARRIAAWVRREPRAQAALAGFLLGDLPAIVGRAMGRAPSSPGGLVPLGVVWGNVRIAARELFGNGSLAGDSGLTPLTVASGAAAVLGIALLLARLRRRPGGTGRDPRSVSAAAALAASGLLLGLTSSRMIDTQGIRFLLPFLLAVPVGLACLLSAVARRSRVAAGVLAGVLVANTVIAHRRAWNEGGAQDRYAPLADHLIASGVEGGYADYWVAYHVTALTGERCLIAPASGLDRYPPYTRRLRGLERIVWIGAPAGQGEVELRGVRYRVVSNEVWADMPVARLEAVPPSSGGVAR